MGTDPIYSTEIAAARNVRAETGIYAFAGFTLDLGRGRLRKGEVDIALRPKSFLLLTFLVQNAGRVIGKNELIEAAWPNVATTDDSLTQCIKDIRRALGPGSEALLRTLPRRGYVLDDGVFRDIADRSPAAKAGAATGVSIAVSPFQVVGEAPVAAAFAVGLRATALADLACFRDLDVVTGPPNTEWIVAGCAGPHLSPAAYTLTGSVQSHGERIRITAALTETAASKTIWAERWDRELGDVLAVQGEIVENLVSALAGFGVILQAAAERAARKPPCERSAQDFYFLGRSHTARASEADARQAVLSFRAALDLAPRLARAWMGLAWSFGQLAGFGIDEIENREAMQRAAWHAVELDPLDGEAQAVLGEALGQAGNMRAAEKAFDRALHLAPRSADIWVICAAWAVRSGRPFEGIRAMERARRLNPGWPAWYDHHLRPAWCSTGSALDQLLAGGRGKASWQRLLDGLAYPVAGANQQVCADANISPKTMPVCLQGETGAIARAGFHLRSSQVGLAQPSSFRTTERF